MNNLELYLGKDGLEKLKKIDDLYLKSQSLVIILFKEKFDKIGNPYINHLLRVSSKMTTLDGKVAGLLHDVVEDIPNVTFEDLLDIGIPNNIIDVLKLVTKETSDHKLTKEEKLIKYNEEIDRIIVSNNKLALELKIVDMTDNYNPERLRSCTKSQREWFDKKYGPQLVKLKNANR